MSNRKYEIREAGNGFLSKLGTGIIAAGSVTAAVVAVSPQGAALESLIYNPRSCTCMGASINFSSAAARPLDALSRVWGYEYDPGTNIVDVYIRYLRQKVGSDAIRTVRGIGYRID